MQIIALYTVYNFGLYLLSCSKSAARMQRFHCICCWTLTLDFLTFKLSVLLLPLDLLRPRFGGLCLQEINKRSKLLLLVPCF